MNPQSADEHELAVALVTSLNLEGTAPADIDPVAPLFGHNSASRGLGLDSIDALEIALVIQQKYGVHVKSDDPDRVLFNQKGWADPPVDVRCLGNPPPY